MPGEFLDVLRQRVVVADGAMGTELYQRSVPLNVSYDELNLTRPSLVAQIHADYLQAGAELIETNTFGANRLALQRFNLAEKTEQINAAAVKLARTVVGHQAFVAGAVGPLPPPEFDAHLPERSPQEVYEVYRQQILALAQAGVDLIILETFTDLDELHQALRAAKENTSLPVVAQLTFHHRAVTSAGLDVCSALQGLADAGADVVGTNCGRGVSNVLHIVEQFGCRSHALISAFPNAGLPENVGGRIMYLASPQYTAEMAEKMVQAGANLVGGCCGTGPRQIAALAARLRGRAPAPRSIRPPEPARPAKPATRPPPRPMTFLDRVKHKAALLVEVDPPFGLDYQPIIDACRMLAEMDVDAITMGDSPLAALRMSNVATASLVQRHVGIDCIVHLCCRDQNLIALQATLMGAWALGIRSVLAITGDPARTGNQPGASSVYDLNSIGLIKLLARLNEGFNLAGASIKQPTGFAIGCGFNPNVRNLQPELTKLKRKIDAGAQFVLTQLIFDPDPFVESVRLARQAGIEQPIFPAVSPLLSHRNAQFIHNELPGCRLPEHILQRMARHADDKRAARREGLAIAKQVIEQIWDHADGIYIVPPLSHYELAAELADFVRSAARTSQS